MVDSIRKVKKAERKNSFFWGVLVLCLLIVGESLWVINRFSTSKMVPTGIKKVARKSVASVRQKKKASLPEVEVWVEGPEKLAVGQINEISVGIEGKERVDINGVDLVLFYDSSRIKIIDQDSQKAGIQVQPVQAVLGKMARNLVDADKGRVIVSLLNLDESGVTLDKGERKTLAKIKIVPRSTGKVNFRLKLADAGQPGTKVSKAGVNQGLAVLVKSDYQATVLGSEK